MFSRYMNWYHQKKDSNAKELRNSVVKGFSVSAKKKSSKAHTSAKVFRSDKAENSTENPTFYEADYDYVEDVDSVLPSSNLPDDDKVTK